MQVLTEVLLDLVEGLPVGRWEARDERAAAGQTLEGRRAWLRAFITQRISIRLKHMKGKSGKTLLRMKKELIKGGKGGRVFEDGLFTCSQYRYCRVGGGGTYMPLLC